MIDDHRQVRIMETVFRLLTCLSGTFCCGMLTVIPAPTGHVAEPSGAMARLLLAVFWYAIPLATLIGLLWGMPWVMEVERP